MKICRFNDDRIGVVEGDLVHDVTDFAAPHLARSWPVPYEDPLVAGLDALREGLAAAARTAAGAPLRSVRLLSPVARPPKLVAAPVNYRKHVDEAVADAGIHYGSEVKGIRTAGLFLKSPTSLAGPSQPLALRFPDRRNDHEVELAVVIGRAADRVSVERALEHVAGYCVGLDITVRGPEDRSFRKSPDGYSVLGPWMVTADEFGSPSDVGLRLTVNGQPRQSATTADLLVGVPELISWASQWYGLMPGDVIFTGTPEGVGEICSGDLIDAEVDGVGAMRVHVA